MRRETPRINERNKRHDYYCCRDRGRRVHGRRGGRRRPGALRGEARREGKDIEDNRRTAVGAGTEGQLPRVQDEENEGKERKTMKSETYYGTLTRVLKT